MTRRIRLIADDYGLAPGVSAGILDLLDRGRLTGTSCMTGFPEWPDAAARIKLLCGRAAVGLHLTLTDQPATTGQSSLAPEGRLPPLRSLALPVLRAAVAALSSMATFAQAGVSDRVDGPSQAPPPT